MSIETQGQFFFQSIKFLLMFGIFGKGFNKYLDMK